MEKRTGDNQYWDPPNHSHRYWYILDYTNDEPVKMAYCSNCGDKGVFGSCCTFCTKDVYKDNKMMLAYV